MTVVQFPSGPSVEQQARDLVTVSIATLGRMLKNRQALKRAARWDKLPAGGRKWTEDEKRAAEHQCDAEIEALDTALVILRVTEKTNG